MAVLFEAVESAIVLAQPDIEASSGSRLILKVAALDIRRVLIPMKATTTTDSRRGLFLESLATLRIDPRNHLCID